MAKSILMPQVGQDLTEGLVIAMNVKVGDSVKKGDIVAEVESEKATFEVEAFEEGTVTDVCFGEGEMAIVLEPLIVLDGADSGGAAAKPAPTATTDDTANAEGTSQAATKSASVLTPPSGKPRSTPLARRMMKQHGIDIASLTGSGPGGAIVQRDVEAAIAARVADAAPAAASAPAAAPRQTHPSVTIPAREGDTVIEFSRMRQVIADRLQLSKQTVPHFYLQTDVDVTHLMGRRAERNAVGGTKISVNDVIIQAAAQCLREYPNLNAHVSQSSLTVKADINVGMAVSVDEGLMVPVLGNADGMSLAEIADQSREAANNARRGISKSASPGTFTISNLGMFGVEVFPIINPPEAAILGVGDIRQEPKAIGAGIAIRSMMRLVLSADHRAVDGAYAARFLAQLKLDLESHNLSH